MSASPVTPDDLAPVTSGATACDHLLELGATRLKMKNFLAWLLADDDTGNLGDGFKEALLQQLLFDAAKKGYLVRSNPTTGYLELVAANDLTVDLFAANSIRLNRLDITSAVTGDMIRLIGGVWARHTPFYGAPSVGGTTVPLPAAGGLLYAAHGLGVVPKEYDAYIECGTAELGYAVGDRLKAHSIVARSPAPENSIGVTVSADATNVYAAFQNMGGGSYRIIRKDTQAGAAITEASWNVKLYATY